MTWLPWVMIAVGALCLYWLYQISREETPIINVLAAAFLLAIGVYGVLGGFAILWVGHLKF